MSKFSYKYLEDLWTDGYCNFILKNPDFNIYLVKKSKDKWWQLSYNPNITWDIIQNNPDKYWDWSNISRNPNITWDIIQNNPDKDWDWQFISRNPNITWDIIQNNPDKDWDWTSISEHPNITWEIIQNNPDKDWDWNSISEHPNITWEIIQNNPDKDWNWNYISCNTMEKGKERWINDKRLHIIKALQIQRHWRNCSCNPQFALARRLIIKRLKD